MKYLVTGGAGFIGSNFIHYLFGKYPDCEVINLDKLTYAGNLDNLQGLENNPRYKFIKKDICNLNVVIKVILEHRIDTIIHFAAATHVDRSISNVLEDKPNDITGNEPQQELEEKNKYQLFKHLMDHNDFVLNNVWGTDVLLQAAVKTKIKRFHHISTDEVFGDLPLNTSDKFNENTPYNPSSPYSASKAASDHLVRAYFRTFGLPVTISNCSNNYGPRQYSEKFIPTVILNALKDQKIPVYGKGENIRDWIHVDDHNAAVDLIIQKGKIGETYLIGGNSERANLDVVKKVLQILGKPESLIEFVTDRPGHDLRYAIDSSKIELELGWKREYDFESGLAQTIKWYQDHASDYRV